MEGLKKPRDLTGRRGRRPLQPFAHNDKNGVQNDKMFLTLKFVMLNAVKHLFV